MTAELLLWRDGRVDGVLRERRGRLSLRYEAGARPISLSMPVRSTPYGDRVARPWFKGLLPEGPARLVLAYDVGVDPDDDFGLLGVLGRDCAGALSLRAQDDPPVDASAGPLLDHLAIGALLRSLPGSPMGFDGGFRVSLPGNQHKLLLTRTASGWHRPDGAPSTHILKPPVPGLGEATVENEAYCQRLAATAGLPAAAAEIGEFDGVRVLVSERYDRVVDPSGSLRRVHQEDGCQALAIDPRIKYQSATGGPSLRAIAQRLSDHGAAIDDLLQMATFTVLIGNADWHGKNVSLLLADDGQVSVAPMYDAMSTRLYETTSTGEPVTRTLGMYIGDQTDIDGVHVRDLIDEGRSWGLGARRAARVVDETVEAVRSALAAVEPSFEQVRTLVSARIDRIR